MAARFRRLWLANERWSVAFLRISLTCLVLAVIGILLVPFALAKVLAGVLAVLFVLFLVLGLAAVDNLAV
jgi:hypothetical protein